MASAKRKLITGTIGTLMNRPWSNPGARENLSAGIISELKFKGSIIVHRDTVEINHFKLKEKCKGRRGVM